VIATQCQLQFFPIFATSISASFRLSANLGVSRAGESSMFSLLKGIAAMTACLDDLGVLAATLQSLVLEALGQQPRVPLNTFSGRDDGWMLTTRPSDDGSTGGLLFPRTGSRNTASRQRHSALRYCRL